MLIDDPEEWKRLDPINTEKYKTYRGNVDNIEFLSGYFDTLSLVALGLEVTYQAYRRRYRCFK